MVSTSEFALVARLPVALQRHRGPCWNDILNGEIGRLSQLSVRRPKKLFKTNSRLLYFWHAIPLANLQPELARMVEYDVGDADRLEMCILLLQYVSKTEEFLDCGDHSRD